MLLFLYKGLSLVNNNNNIHYPVNKNIRSTRVHMLILPIGQSHDANIYIYLTVVLWKGYYLNFVSVEFLIITSEKKEFRIRRIRTIKNSWNEIVFRFVSFGGTRCSINIVRSVKARIRLGPCGSNILVSLWKRSTKRKLFDTVRVHLNRVTTFAAKHEFHIFPFTSNATEAFWGCSRHLIKFTTFQI